MLEQSLSKVGWRLNDGLGEGLRPTSSTIRFLLLLMYTTGKGRGINNGLAN